MTRVRRIQKFSIIVALSILTLGYLPWWAKTNLDAPLVQAHSNVVDISPQSVAIQTVPVASFIQAGDTDPATDDANNWLFDFDGGFLTSDSATSPVCLTAPVYLATGSAIDSFTVYASDEANIANLTVFLDRTGLLGNWGEIAAVSTSGQTAGIQTLTSSTIAANDNGNIVSADYNYHVSFCLPANSGGHIKVYGAQVAYTQAGGAIMSVYLPLVQKSTPPSLTILLITNQTGNNLDYTVYNTPEGTITCTIPNGATNQVCGAFTPGVYSYKAVAWCGQKVGQRVYKSGNDTLTPFRCF